MNAVVLALLLAADAPCALPGLEQLPAESRANACELSQRPNPAPAAPLDALHEIYERPGFEKARQRTDGAIGAYLAQLRAWIERLFGTSGAETYSNLTRLVVLGLALAVGVTVVLRVLARRRQPIATKETTVLRGALELDDPSVHRQRADALLAAEPRQAIREGWLAVLSSLERKRLARPDRVKTNRELVEELPGRGASSELVDSTRALVSWFDRAFYSLDAIAPDEARRFLGDVDRVLGAP